MKKLQDFAREMGITDRAVQKHLQKYAAEFEGHVERKGPGGTWLDETAQEILRGKIKRQPITVFEEDPRIERLQSENADLQNRLLKAFELLDKMQQKNDVLQASLDEQKLIAAQVGEATRRAEEAEQAASDARERVEKIGKENAVLISKKIDIELALTAAEKENETLSNVAELNAQEAKEAKARADREALRASEAEAELERLRKRGFWARLWNKE